jgi:hypothetical protein
MVYDMVRFLPAVGASSERVNDEWGLAKHCPEFPRPGSLICFSDRRQDAAYFAPALDLTYSNHTRRQILLEAIRQARHHPCSPTEIVSELKDSLLQKYRVKNDGGELIDKNDRERHAWSWVIGELTADDYRNSLEGLGLIKCTLPDIFDDTIDGKASVVLEKHGLGWMQPQDFKAIAHHCIESLRANRGLATEGIRPKDKLLPDNRPFRQISKQAEKNSRNISFIPKNKSHGLNSRLDFVNKLLARHYRERQSREAAIEILELCYAFIVDLLKALAVWLLRQRGTGSPQLVVPAFR